MRTLITKPYHLLLIVTFALMFFSLFVTTQTTDLHIHDTYYIIETKAIFYLLAGFAFLLWLTYFIARKILSKWLMYIHLFVTLSTIVYLLTVVYNINTSPISYNSWTSFEQFKDTSNIIAIIFFIFFIAQLLFVINIFTGLIKNKNVKRWSYEISLISPIFFQNNFFWLFANRLQNFCSLCGTVSHLTIHHAD
jgi:hypothetical protein